MNPSEPDLREVVHLLQREPRVLLEADLEPRQGHRFQPTGFPDLGAAVFTLPNGTDMLLVESPQSIANRLEAVCWDDPAHDVVPVLRGLPFVRVTSGGTYLTSSIQEFHRLNSPYLLESDNRDFLRILARDLLAAPATIVDGPAADLAKKLKDFHATAPPGMVDNRALARFIFKYDPNCLLHGVFLARDYLAGGRLRLQRIVSGFIEASDVRAAESGGVKFDQVDPSGDTGRGFGHVPFHRTEYTARQIVAYFNLDLATLHGYGLPARANDLIVALALWKIGRFLQDGLRLRTACDLSCPRLRWTWPDKAGLTLGAADIIALGTLLPTLIEECADLFARPRVTDIVWSGTTKAKKGTASAAATVSPDDAEDEDGD